MEGSPIASFPFSVGDGDGIKNILAVQVENIRNGIVKKSVNRPRSTEDFMGYRCLIPLLSLEAWMLT